MSDTPTREGLIRQLQEIAGRLGVRSISKSVYWREGGASERTITKHFDTWNGYVAAAGLEPDESRRRLDDEDLWAGMADAFEQAGGIVTQTRFRKLARYSESVYVKRWGRWENVLRHFRAWAEQHLPEFPYLADLPAGEQSAPAADAASVHASASPAWTPTQTTQLGPFLNFRGLQHAPINEQDVVFLFGDGGGRSRLRGRGRRDRLPRLRGKAERQHGRRQVGARAHRVRVPLAELPRSRTRSGRLRSRRLLGAQLARVPVEVLELRSAVDGLGE